MIREVVADVDRLPHKSPIRFLTEVLEAREDDAISMLEFLEPPTLSAIVESAAQNVIFIASLYRLYDGGVLTGMKNIISHEKLDRGVYRVESGISAQLDNFCIFNFQLFQESRLMAEGEFNVVMKKR